MNDERISSTILNHVLASTKTKASIYCSKCGAVYGLWSWDLETGIHRCEECGATYESFNDIPTRDIPEWSLPLKTAIRRNLLPKVAT